MKIKAIALKINRVVKLEINDTVWIQIMSC